MIFNVCVNGALKYLQDVKQLRCPLDESGNTPS